MNDDDDNKENLNQVNQCYGQQQKKDMGSHSKPKIDMVRFYFSMNLYTVIV